ncbi:hypothetical protein [Streptomyces echinatus]|uniref:hypothetical protein n=1 Tax=Streptomyces echinatus TaxID=67293 RepID=UPI0038294373
MRRTQRDSSSAADQQNNTDEQRTPHRAKRGHRPVTANTAPVLTTIDRYYLAWLKYRQQRAAEPNAEELAHHLAEAGIHTRAGKPISSSTLRRYILSFRIYTIWAQHRAQTTTPKPRAVAHDCNARNITAQYNKPITAPHITNYSNDFERRWNALSHRSPDDPSSANSFY